MLRRPFFFLALALASGTSLAHPGHVDGGFAAGFVHPLLGVDHLLAMLAVGFWAARFGGGARWLLPAAFVSFMGLGLLVSLPYLEPAIALSLLVLGIAVAAAVRFDARIGAAVVAAFALFHGQAHFAEIPAGLPVGGFAAGMLVATALLHLAGVVLALQGARLSAWLPRAFGASTALAGAWFLLA
jgi:urease accessory protein